MSITEKETLRFISDDKAEIITVYILESSPTEEYSYSKTYEISYNPSLQRGYFILKNENTPFEIKGNTLTAQFKANSSTPNKIITYKKIR